MKRLREPISALLVAAACGGSPIESTSSQHQGSSSTGEPSSSSGAVEGSSSSTSMPPTSSSEELTGEPTSIDPVESSGAPESSEAGSESGAVTCTPILHEVLYDPDSGRTDSGFEWIELFNPCADEIDLGNYVLRWGGNGYEHAAALSGGLAAGGCLVIGGPTSDPINAMPQIDLVLDFEPDLENADSAADAVALFIVDVGIPIDAVIYGDENVLEFVDEQGMVGAPDVGDVARGHSIARADADPGAAWVDSNPPSPNVCPNSNL